MASESGTDLCGLNDDVLRKIAKELSLMDIVNLSETSTRFVFLLPTELNLEGPDFDRDTFESRQPEDYFTSLPMFSGVKKITMTFDWIAKGFSLAIWIEVVREGQVYANSKPEKFLVYEDQEEKKEKRIIVLEDNFVESIKKGDVLRFKRQIGGYSTNLNVYNFKCHLELDN